MKKQWMAILFAAAACLAGCSGGESKESAKTVAVHVPEEPFGTEVKYDPLQPVNNGKDISIEFWEWGSDDLLRTERSTILITAL